MNDTLENKFNKIRRMFPLADPKRKITYLNSASTGPLCLPVKNALYDYYEKSQFSSGSLNRPDLDQIAFGYLDNIRKHGAGMLGCNSKEIGFGFNTGFGLNIAAQGLPLKRGDQVLLSDLEFPANVYPWLVLKEKGIKVKLIKTQNRCFSIENFKKEITSRSKVLSLSFVQFFNGFKNDLKTIGRICKENGIFFVVDGIQGCGVEPINVRNCRIDIFSSGGQKWMLSPLGTAMFYIRHDLQEELTKSFASWLSVDWKLDFTNLFHYDLEFFDTARRFEMGTYPYGHIFAFSKALDIINDLGVRNIQKHNHNLLDTLIYFLKSNSRFEIVSDLSAKHRSSILSFTCDHAHNLYQKLARDKFFLSFREGAIRVSVHLFNNGNDIARLIGALKKY